MADNHLDYHSIAKNIHSNYRDVENKLVSNGDLLDSMNNNIVYNQLSAMCLVFYGLAEMWRNNPDFEYNLFIHICFTGEDK